MRIPISKSIDGDPGFSARCTCSAIAFGQCELRFEPATSKLGALDCVKGELKIEDCKHSISLECAAGATTLHISLELAFRSMHGWRGSAAISSTGDATCSGSYAVAL